MFTDVNFEATQRFVLAIGILLTVDVTGLGVGNPRGVVFTVAPAGEELGFERAAANQGKDVIVLTFELGKEEEGPKNIAVFEERNGQLRVWPRCAFCETDDGRHFIIDYDDRIGFVLWDEKIMTVNNLPPGFCLENAERGSAFLKEFATGYIGTMHRNGFQCSR
ncbi:MAG: hypothetical protein C0510_00125 [Erythrobacter sp.]|nr:hypothetical protein [Erythrobacter sp.]MBA4163030.1 hypothetical protein [Erythrobacter sp.]